MKKIRKAVIPVAGFGTRFLPATIAQPKEMLTVVDRPVIQYIVEELVAAGITEVIFVTGRGKRAIEDHFDYSPELEELLLERGKKAELKEVRRISALARFVYVRQNKPHGNGHAILCAKEVVGDEPFVVAWGDDMIVSKEPATRACMRAFEKYEDTILGVTKMSLDMLSQYGSVAPVNPKTKEPVFEISDVIEKPAPGKAPSLYGTCGRYIFTPEIFSALENVKPGRGGEIWWTDAVRLLFKTRSVYACAIEGTYYDCGNKLEYVKANVALALARKEFNGKFREFISGLS